ncbi:hypothetical protein D3C87_1742190 [compost metagenome]
MAMIAKVHFGKPGTTRNTAMASPDTTSAFGWPSSCRPITLPRFSERVRSSSEETRVMTTPAAMETSSDGICDTMPSPMVRMA